MAGSTGAPSSGNPDIDGVLTGTKWDTTELTFSFPTIRDFYGYEGEPTNFFFGPMTTDQKALVRTWLDHIESVSQLQLTEIEETSTQHADLRFAQTDAVDPALGYPPSNDEQGGDVWIRNTDGNFDFLAKGQRATVTILHEIGHALGLKDGDSVFGYGELPDEHNSIEYSVMSRVGYVGQPSATHWNFYNGHGPQSLMLSDIAALQHLYGANYTTNAGNTTYSWSPTTGEMFINGAGQGASMYFDGVEWVVVNKVFLTIWDGGGTDTYDLSSYTTNLNLDLRPGEWSITATDQLSILGTFEGQPRPAVGNIANAYLFQDNTASLIENATGGSGNDTIRGNTASNVLKGGAGADTLFGETGNDILHGGAGADTIDGGDGIDHAAYDFAASSVSVDLQTGVHTGAEAAGDILIGIEGLQGSAFNDQLFGDAGENYLLGNGGADFIQGRAGADTIFGGDGDDWLDGGAGGDALEGEGGFDVAAYGGSLSAVSLDMLTTTYSGGDASGDFFNSIEGLSGSSFNDQLFGNLFANRLFGQGGADFIQGRAGNDLIDGGDGDDWLDGGLGADQIFGGSGANDIVAYGASISAVYADLASFTFGGGDADGDTYSGVEGVSGSTFNDSLFGDANANRLFGQGGNDFIQGRAGADLIDGGDGDDWLDGGTGGDQIFGGNGANDIVAYGASTTAVNADLAAFVFTGGDAAGDTYSGVEGVSGSSFADQLFGDANANRLFGQGGNDFIQGRAGNDLIDGGDGDDWLDGGLGGDQIFGGNGANDVVAYGASTAAISADLQAFTFTGGDATGDTYSGVEGVSGSAFNDVISGNASANRLFGQGGNDTLAGRGGNDLLTGGANDDSFVFADNGGVDQITDFDDFGNDIIQLSIAGITTFAQVSAVMTQVGADVLIDFATTDILLLGTTLATVQADDFAFV